jgi:hypothetical protein
LAGTATRGGSAIFSGVFGSLSLSLARSFGQNREFSTYSNDIQRKTTTTTTRKRDGGEMRAKGEENVTNHDGGRPTERTNDEERKKKKNKRLELASILLWKNF